MLATELLLKKSPEKCQDHVSIDVVDRTILKMKLIAHDECQRDFGLYLVLDVVSAI
jgi:hypothetical protein